MDTLDTLVSSLHDDMFWSAFNAPLSNPCFFNWLRGETSHLLNIVF